MAMNRVWLPAARPPSATSRVLAPLGTVTKYEVVALRTAVAVFFTT